MMRARDTELQKFVEIRYYMNGETHVTGVAEGNALEFLERLTKSGARITLVERFEA